MPFLAWKSLIKCGHMPPKAKEKPLFMVKDWTRFANLDHLIATFVVVVGCLKLVQWWRFIYGIGHVSRIIGSNNNQQLHNYIWEYLRITVGNGDHHLNNHDSNPYLHSTGCNFLVTFSKMSMPMLLGEMAKSLKWTFF